jgi:aspartyl-tRNA(Asn)/glutamyl-tRNA(Gln) amidotransferase subunit A
MRTVLELAKALADGKLTSAAIVDEALARAADAAGEGPRAFIALDPEKVRAQARASDLMRKAGAVPSPLAGLPIAMKDLFDVAGEVTSAGSVVLQDSAPRSADAPAVARLRAAGAILFGRTNLTEFAFSGIGINPHFGTPKSPFDRVTGRAPGGSSSGSAVAVADRMAVIGMGTDTGGSTRVPAAFCGIVVYKPSKQRIPTDGVFPLSMSLDSAGPMGPSVACCAICDAVLAGEPARAPSPASISALRFAVPSTLVLDALDAEVAQDFERALKRLSAAGAKIVDAELRAFAEVNEINRPGGLAPMEAFFVHRELLERSAERYDPRVRVRIMGGAKASAADYLWTLERRRDWIARMNCALKGFDAMLMPTVACVPPAIAPLAADDDLFRRTNARVLRNTSLINFLDGCALSLPMNEPGKAPTGVMVCGPNGADQRIFSAALAIEALLRPANDSPQS